MSNFATVIHEFALTGIKWLVHRESGAVRGLPSEQVEMLSRAERGRWIETLAVLDALDISHDITTRKLGKN